MAKTSRTAKEQWEDMINENDVVAKLGVSKSTLRRMRRQGQIQNFRYLIPCANPHERCPGKKPVYSLKELTELFSPTAL